MCVINTYLSIGKVTLFVCDSVSFVNLSNRFILLNIHFFALVSIIHLQPTKLANKAFKVPAFQLEATFLVKLSYHIALM